jgi:hypothetical protein
MLNKASYGLLSAASLMRPPPTSIGLAADTPSRSLEPYRCGPGAKTHAAGPASHELSWHTPQIRCCRDPLNPRPQRGCAIGSRL